MKDQTKFNSRPGGCIFSLIKLVILTIIILGVAIYFTIGYVADYALKTITSGTGIDAGVGSVNLSISEQQFGIKNFYITNPPNYSKGNAIEIGEAFIDADITLEDILTKKLIHIKEVRVIGLHADYELKTKSGISALLNAADNNINDIVKAITRSTGEEQPKQEEKPAKENDSSIVDEIKIIIDKLTFEDGQAKVGFNGAVIPAPLPAFTINDLGKSEGGITASQMATEVLSKLSQKITVDVLKAIGNEGYKGASDATKQTTDAAKSLLKSLFK